MPLKSISGYAQIGAMDRQVDIWDQPPKSLPVLFASGVWAQVSTTSASSLSPVSTELGQNSAWPRLTGNDVAQVSHSVSIAYMPGLLSRMFLLYNDPDNGARRFDIDHIVDPDERKMELRIVGIERKDGADPFDALLNMTLDILIRNTSPGDSRGMSSPVFTVIALGVPCRVAQGKGVPRGKEDFAKSKLAIAYREVFMRPWFADPSPDGSYIPNWLVSGNTFNTQPLTHYHWLRIPSVTSPTG
jgi:hypothetical protein